MTKREKILREIERCDNDQAIRDLQLELTDLQQRIPNHELERMKRRALECALQIEQLQFSQMRTRNRLEVQLQEEEPQVLHDLRRMITAAFDRHSLTDPPTILFDRNRNPVNSSEFDAWKDRGEGLLKCSVALRDMWKVEDWREELSRLIDQHRDAVAELRHVQVPEKDYVVHASHQ